MAHDASYMLYDGKSAYTLSDSADAGKIRWEKGDGQRHTRHEDQDDPRGVYNRGKMSRGGLSTGCLGVGLAYGFKVE